MKDKRNRDDLYELRQGERAPKAPQKKPNIFFRLLAFVLTLALMVGAVALVVYRDSISFDALRRWFSYRAITKNSSGQPESFRYDGASDASFAAVGDNLLVCSDAGLKLYSGSGDLYVQTQTVLDSPITQSSGTYALAYGAGGRDLFVYKDNAQVFTLEDGAGDILSARINPSGYLAVTTRASGYKGSATVYGDNASPLLQLNLSSRFMTDALVSRDNKTLAAITMGQTNGGFESTLGLYALARTPEDTEPDAVCSLGRNVILDVSESADLYWALGDTALTLVGKEGTLVSAYDYAGRYLKEFSLGGEGFSALLLGKYRAGTMADLVVVDSTGAELASQSIGEQILSLSAAGRYLAVLTAGRLDIYTSDLTLYRTLEGVQGARKVLMRQDGTAMLVGGNTAQLYIPS